MASVPVDTAKVATCRALAADVASDVQSYVDRHTTVGVERAILRAYGVEGASDQGVPIVNTVVERYQAAGLLGRGIALYLGRALVDGARDVPDAARRLAHGARVYDGDVDAAERDRIDAALDAPTREALARIDGARDDRDARRRRALPGPE